MKMYELMNIFPILTGICKKAAKGFFYLHLKNSEKAFTFWTATNGKKLNMCTRASENFQGCLPQ